MKLLNVTTVDLWLSHCIYIYTSSMTGQGPVYPSHLLLLGLTRLWPAGFFGRGATLVPLRRVTSVRKAITLHHQQWKCCYRLVKAYIVMACLQTMVAQEPSVSVLQPAPAGILHWVDQNHNYNWHYTVKTSQCIAHGHYMVIKVPVSLLLVAVKWSQT